MKTIEEILIITVLALLFHAAVLGGLLGILKILEIFYFYAV